MRDVFQKLLVSSDPLVSGLWLTPTTKSQALSSEAIQSLLPLYTQSTAESLYNSDVSADLTDDWSYLSD